MTKQHNERLAKLMRISIEEAMHIEAILTIAIESATKETPRLKIIKSAHKKIYDSLEQLEKDGLIDFSKIKV